MPLCHRRGDRTLPDAPSCDAGLAETAQMIRAHKKPRIPWQAAIKRAFDVVAAGFGLVLMSPLSSLVPIVGGFFIGGSLETPFSSVRLSGTIGSEQQAKPSKE